MFQMLFDLVILGIGVKVIFGATKMGIQRQSGSGAPSGAGHQEPGPTRHE
jgi:hypothetical protein